MDLMGDMDWIIWGVSWEMRGERGGCLYGMRERRMAGRDAGSRFYNNRFRCQKVD